MSKLLGFKGYKSFHFFILGMFLLFLSAVTLIMGILPWERVWEGAFKRLTFQSSEWNALLDERLPRLIVLLCTGASLAVSGAITQSLFCNPIASPSVLGITAGGSLLSCVALVFKGSLAFPVMMPAAACFGSLGALLLVYNLSKYSGSVSLYTLLLAGTAMTTVFMTLQSVLVYTLRDHWQLIQTIQEWEAGSTYNRSWSHVHMQLPLTIVGLLGCWRYRYELNMLALGDEEAFNLGVDVPKVRWRLFLSLALLTGGALAGIGAIAFFGLILPHLLRCLVGADNRYLIPLCILGGSLSLLALDLMLKIFSIRTLTIGNISSLIGGLFFFFLLFTHVKREAHA